MDKHNEYMEKMIREQIEAEKYEEERSKQDDNKKSCLGEIPSSCIISAAIGKMSKSISYLTESEKIDTDPDYITAVIDLYRSQRMLINLAKNLESEGN